MGRPRFFMRRSPLGNKSYLVNMGKYRMGDVAATRAVLNTWRATDDVSYLTLRIDLSHPRCFNTRRLDMSWLFDGVVDEIIPANVARSGPILSVPGLLPGGQLEPLWVTYKLALTNFLLKGRTPPYKLSLDSRGTQIVDAIRRKYSLPSRYVAVQPLIDANYNGYRNGDRSWWRDVVVNIAAAGVPVVVLGVAANIASLEIPPLSNIFFAHPDLQNPQDALYFVCSSSVFVGGETGFSLWAANMGVPVVSALRMWGPGDAKGAHKNCDFRPLGFWAPVRFADLSKEAPLASKEAVGLFTGEIKESTPY